jgi:macrolide-specific efflux system membrane fusion protein
MNDNGSSRLALNLGLMAVLVAIGVAAYLVLGGGGGQATQGQTVTTNVTRGNVQSTVSASGTIESSETVGPSFTSGGIVTAVLVDVGDHVRKGQVLARVDASNAQADLQVASANVDSAEAGVTSALASLSSAQAGVTSARASLSSAYTNLRELRHSDTATDAQIADAQAQVISARSQIDQAEASSTSARSQIDQAEASLSSANTQVTQAQEAVSETVLRAPVAGTVVEVNGSVGQSAGGTTSESTTSSGTSSTSSTSDTSGFIVISDLKNLQVLAYFSETDTAQLRVGQRASVTLNALPDEQVSGKVIAIDTTSTTVNQVVDYGVTIELEDRPNDVRVGQTAVVVVITGRAKDVLSVPSSVVQTTGGQDTVTVLRDGKQVSTVVELGLTGDQTTEIVSGLSEGDEVVVPSTTSSTGFPSGGFPGGVGLGGAGS